MDVVGTVTTAETTAEVVVGVTYDQEPEIAEKDRVDTAEMGELPVEDWDYQRPRRGEVRTGVILAIREQEVIVDVGAKRDGIVPYADMQRMGAEALATLSVGEEIPVYVLRPEDQDGNLLVSLYLARQERSWQQAQELAESGQVLEEQVIGYNKGGLVLPVGEIRGFVPASQIPGFPHGLNQEERIDRLSEMVGETLLVRVIEINRRKRRLILSGTAALRQWRKQQRERLLSGLREGQVCRGVVSSLCSFGAFVDLGGADGLIHLSELSWRRVRHPREVVNVGDEVEVFVLRLDHEKKRIGLSLKRLNPEPWALVEDKYELGQLVEGVVTNVVDFGAFAEIEEGIEGLIHVSELSDGPISHPREVVKRGDLLLLRIVRVDARRKRLGLSLKRVLESEWAEWAARLAIADAERSRDAKEQESPEIAEVEESAAGVLEEAAEAKEEEPQAIAEVEELAAAVLEEAAEAEEEEPQAIAEVEELAAGVLEEAAEAKEEELQAIAEVEEPAAAVLEEAGEAEEEEPQAIAEVEEPMAAVSEEPAEAQEEEPDELAEVQEPVAAVSEEPADVQEEEPQGIAEVAEPGAVVSEEPVETEGTQPLTVEETDPAVGSEGLP